MNQITIHRIFSLQRILLLFLPIILLSLLASSCGGRSGEVKKTAIAGIVFQEDQFFRMIELGMKDAAAREDADLMLGNSFGSLDKEIALVDSYIAGRVAALVISPLSKKASIPALERAHKAGIKVIAYNTAIDSPILSSYIESDQTDLGASTGKAVQEYINTRLGGKAKIAMIEFMSQAPEQASMRVDGFKSIVAKMPGVEIVAEQDAWLVQQAADVVEQIITAHPDLNIVWAANEGGTIGAAIAVKNAGKGGQIAVFGIDMSEQIAEFLLSDNNILQAVTGQKPFEIGSLAVQNAVRILRGESVEVKVSLPGILFTRTRPEEVSEYQQSLKKMSQ